LWTCCAVHSGASARERARIYEQLSSIGPSSGSSDVMMKLSHDDCKGGNDELGDSMKAKLLLKAKKKAEKEAHKVFEERARLELERSAFTLIEDQRH